MKLRVWLIGLLSLFVVVGGAVLYVAPAQAVTCPAVTKTLTGTQTSGVSASNNGGTWDFTTAVWNNSPYPVEYPVRSESWTKGCLYGGTVNGNIPRSQTRDQWYNGEDGGTHYGGEAYRHTLTNTAGNFLYMRNSYASDVEDAFDPQATNFDSTVYLDHVHAKYIRDDCIENEGSGSDQHPASMKLTNVLFDGCFTGFGMRPSGSTSQQNGEGPQTFDVENSLVYIQPQPLGPIYCSDTSVNRGRCKPTGTSNVWLGSYGIWKWSDKAPSHVVVRNTIFRLDMPSYSSCRAQEWPAGTYENVTLVWTGDGAYKDAGDCSNVLPPGVTLTTDVSVWNNAKNAWLNGSTEPTPTPTATPTSTVSSTPTVSPSPTETVSPSPTTKPCTKKNPHACKTRHQLIQELDQMTAKVYTLRHKVNKLEHRVHHLERVIHRLRS